MMLLALIRKEFLVLSRDLHGLAALFVMPALFIVVMSLALQDIYTPPVDNLEYAVSLGENTPLAERFARDWQAAHGPARALPADWPQAVRSGRLQYVVRIEAGFAATVSSPQAPSAPRVRLVAEPGLDQSLFLALQGRVFGRLGALRAEAVQERFLGFAAPNSQALDRLVTAERAGAADRPLTSVQQNVPAWLVFGIFFVVTSIASLFVQEQRDGTLARLASIGVTTRTQILAKALPYLGVNAIQAVLMFAVGIYLIPLLGGSALSLAGIDWLALIVMLTAISLGAIAFALLLATLARTHAQANALGPMCNILMAATGGIMVPAFIMPEPLQAVAALSPMNWALEGLLTVLLRHGDLGAILPQLARLLAFAAVLFGAATLLFRRRISS